MARYLALDWDHNHICVVAANVAGGAVRVQRALVLPEAAALTPAEAEAAGARLRDHLKAAKISPAPVLACLGRERLIVRDVRYPGVADHEEPGVIRFQALKEMTHAPDEVVVDYARVGEAGANGERRALVLIAKRDHIAAYQALCKAAGLKLAGVTARPFGLAACLERVAGTTVLTPLPEPPGSAVAVVAVGEGWAEFVVCRGGAPLLARSLVPGPGIAAEIRRNLTVYSGQAGGQGVRAVYVVGGPENAALRERLRQLVELPVHVLDPFGGSEQADLPVAEKRGGFAGLVGVLHQRADKKGLSIDFLRPKQPRPPADPNKRRTLLWMGLAASALFGLATVGYLRLSALTQQLAAQAFKNAEQEKVLTLSEDDAKRIKAIGDWDDQAVVWLDELHDLVARFPDPDKDQIRLSMLSARVIDKPPTSKDPHVAQMSLKGVTGNDLRSVNQLVGRLSEDGHYRVDTAQPSSNRGPDARAGFTQQFTIQRIEVQKRAPEKYTLRMDEEKDEKPKGRARRGR